MRVPLLFPPPLQASEVCPKGVAPLQAPDRRLIGDNNRRFQSTPARKEMLKADKTNMRLPLLFPPPLQAPDKRLVGDNNSRVKSPPVRKEVFQADKTIMRLPLLFPPPLQASEVCPKGVADNVEDSTKQDKQEKTVDSGFTSSEAVKYGISISIPVTLPCQPSEVCPKVSVAEDVKVSTEQDLEKQEKPVDSGFTSSRAVKYGLVAMGVGMGGYIIYKLCTRN